MPKNQDLIFVFANCITKIQELSEKFNISIIGTNNPDRLIEEINNANDVSHYFFVLNDDNEVSMVNNLFSLLEPNDELNNSLYILYNKKLGGKIRLNSHKPLTREYIDITESMINDLIISVVIHNQTQYFSREESINVSRISANEMKRLSEKIDNLSFQSSLKDLKDKYYSVKENQSKLSVSKLILEADIGSDKSPSPIRLDTQEFLKDQINELRDKMKTCTNKEDLRDLLGMIFDLLQLSSDDLASSSKELVDKIIEEEKEKSQSLLNSHLNMLEEIESSIVQQDKKEVDFMIEKRNAYLKQLKSTEEELNNRIMLVQSTAKEYLLEMRGTTQEVLNGEYKDLLPVEVRKAFQERHSANGVIVTESLNNLISMSNDIIEELQHLVSKFNKLVTIDTSIIESQQRIVETLSTQKVYEKVTYKSSLESKLHLLVSPTSNLGASSMINIFKNKWSDILVLDFREDQSSPLEFQLINNMEEFLSSDINTLKGYVKVQAPLCVGLKSSQDLEDKLELLESNFESIFVIVDKNMSVGLDFDKFKKVMYLSDTSPKNLLDLNSLKRIYEDLFKPNTKFMFILNKLTPKKKSDVSQMLQLAGIDSSRIKINTVAICTEFIDEDESKYKEIHMKFNYF